MANRLDGRRIGILSTDGFERIERTAPMTAPQAAGATVAGVSPEAGAIKGSSTTRRATT